MIAFTEMRRIRAEDFVVKTIFLFWTIKFVMPVRNSSLDVGYVDTYLVWSFRWKSGMEINYVKLPVKNVKIEKGRHIGVEFPNTPIFRS